MTSNENLTLYVKLAGLRLNVLANRFGCDTEFLRDLHDRLVGGLDAAISRIRSIMAMERNLLAGDDEFAEFQLEGEMEILRRFTIDLLDDLEIDFGTHEYRIKGGNWIIALAADCTGGEIDYPELVDVPESELGSLALLIAEITAETGIPVRASRIV